MARRKIKRVKATKKPRGKKKPRGVAILTKRRGKAIYDIELPKGNKTEKEIDELISDVNFNKIKDEDVFVKITFVAKLPVKLRTKKKLPFASITSLDEFDYENKSDLMKQIKKVCMDMNFTIFRKPVKGTGESVKRMNRLKNYLERIIIDFETAS